MYRSGLRFKCFFFLQKYQWFYPLILERSSHWRCSIKKVVLEILQIRRSHLCQSLFFNKVACNLIRIETLVQALSCEFCEISQNKFFTKHVRMTASLLKKVICIRWHGAKVDQDPGTRDPPQSLKVGRTRDPPEV